MTAPSTVQITAPCPTCGRDCLWNGSRTEPSHGTEYRILCDRCSWTWQEQAARRRESA